ncbi:MAG: hypothetical protein ACJAWZ_004056, partial [Paracoccaceae bacterium]
MGLRFFSDKDRPVHMGPYPAERLARAAAMPDLTKAPVFAPLDFRRAATPESIVNAMAEYQAMLDAIRGGMVNKAQAEIPADPKDRADHLKAFGYFSDASMIGICALPALAHLDAPVRNPDIDRLASSLRTRQTKTLASGIDMIMADLRDSMAAPPSTIKGHTHTIVYLYEHMRDPAEDEPGGDWIKDAQAHRACLRATETAAVIANYIRLLGWDAQAHSAAATDVDLNRLTVAAGLASIEGGDLVAPWIGKRFGVAVVTTTLVLAVDAPLAPMADQPWFRTQG